MFFNNAAPVQKIYSRHINWFAYLVRYWNISKLQQSFCKSFYDETAIDSGRSIMYAYAAIALGDIAIGFVSQYFKSRKKALYVFYGLTILSEFIFSAH